MAAVGKITKIEINSNAVDAETRVLLTIELVTDNRDSARALHDLFLSDRKVIVMPEKMLYEEFRGFVT